MNNIILRLSDGVYSSDLTERIKANFEKAKRFTLDTLEIDNIEITCQDDSIKRSGGNINGYTPTKHQVDIFISPDNNPLDSEMLAVMCHELSHVKRYITMNHEDHGADMTLIDYLAFEGLAIAIEKEVLGRNSRSSKMLSDRTGTVKLVERFRVDFGSRDYYVQDLRYGNEEKNIPWRAVYEMGYYLVRSKMKATGKKASELMVLPSEEFAE
jgi:uncharacterized protein YjaZ